MAENKSKPKIATRYDYASRPKLGLRFDQKDPKSISRTNQSDRDSTDVNVLMKQFEETGFIPDQFTGNMRKPTYGDFTVIGDFFTIQNQIARTKQAFEALPASIRSQFKNDAGELVEFLADPNNDEAAIQMGLKTPSESRTASRTARNTPGTGDNPDAASAAPGQPLPAAKNKKPADAGNKKASDDEA